MEQVCPDVRICSTAEDMDDIPIIGNAKCFYSVQAEREHVSALIADAVPEVLDAFTGFGMSAESLLRWFCVEVGNSAWTLLDANLQPVAMVGVSVHFRGAGGGCARAWAFPTKRMYKLNGGRKAFLRSCKMCLEEIQQGENLHRIEAIVMEGFEEGKRLCRYKGIGFEQVGILRGYDLDKNNYLLFDKVYDN